MRICDLYDLEDQTELKAIKINSKEVEEGDIFVCTMGVTVDRHDFIQEAVNAGAKLLVISRDVETYGVPFVKVEDTNQELIRLARKFYRFHDEDLSLIGVTGTNGKTTICMIIQELLGHICAYMGTNGILYGTHQEKIRNTTPDADRLYLYFRKFIDEDCQYLSMEASSEAFFRHRLDGLKFNVGILSNITEDHLNIHQTIENYVDCKMQLFRNVQENGASILNIDDDYFALAKSNAKGKILTYGKKEGATLQIKEVLDTDFGSKIVFAYENVDYEVESKFLGEVNAYNLAASILCLLFLGYAIEDIFNKIPHLSIVPGRLEEVIHEPYSVILDYAHTTDSFKKILPILNRRKKGRLIVVTGSAGGREKEKRKPMGAYILASSDFVIFTMDDPRHENVSDIIADLISGSDETNYEIIENRVDAIHRAFSIAKEGDIVLVAGKGVDNYMAVGDEYLPYSDLEVIESYFEEKEN